ncbi:MAG: DNA-binding CsgD family transcriptional regulator [Verrucomicrobiales bacterium]
MPAPPLGRNFELPDWLADHFTLEVDKTIRRLTSREFAVLSWAAAGKNNIEVAMILELSRQMVERDLTAIYGVLEVEHRFAATAHFLRWQQAQE